MKNIALRLKKILIDKPWLATAAIVLLFAGLSGMCHITFLLWPATMFGMGGTDSFSQMMPAASFVESLAAKGDLGWSWSYGLGGDVYSEFIYYYTSSPLFWLTYLVKSLFGAAGEGIYITQHWKMLLSIFKQTSMMISMYALLRYEGKRRSLSCLSAVSYAMPLWFLHYSLRFDYMPDVMIYLPLAVLAWRVFVRSDSRTAWIPLSVCVAVIICNNLLTGYMCCILLASMFIVFSGESGSSWRARLRYIARLIVPVAVGVLLSAIGFLPAVKGFLTIDRTAVEVSRSPLPTRELIHSTVEALFSAGGLISLQPFALLACFALLAKCSPLCRRKSMLAGLWLLACIVPLAYTIMSGMSYASDRWYFAVIFVCAYALPDWLENLTAQQPRRIKYRAVLPVAGAIFTAVWAAWTVSDMLPRILQELQKGSEFSVVLCAARTCAGVCGLVVAIMLVERTDIRLIKRRISGKKAQAVLCWALVLAVAVGGVATNIYFIHSRKLDVAYTEEQHSYLITGSAQLVSASAELCPQEGEFWRVDDADVNASKDRYENRSWFNHDYTVSAYNSLIDGALHSYLKKDLQLYQRYVQPSYYRGFNDRLFLETAWGVAYKLGCDAQGAGECYTEYRTESGLTALHNTCATGFDMWYDTVIPAQEYNAFTLAQRDAALLQAVRADGLAGDYSPAVLDDVTDSFELTLADAVTEGCVLSGNTLTVDESGILTFTLPQAKEQGEYLLSLTIIETSSERFTMSINGMETTRFEKGYAWGYEYDSFTARLPGGAQEAVIGLSAGQYVISALGLEYNSYEAYESWTQARNRYNLSSLVIDGSSVSGVLDNEQAGILVLSMPYSEGWSCTVNGEQRELVKANGMFTALELDAGHNEIELHYTSRVVVAGAIISCVTALGLLIYFLVCKKRLTK